MAPPPILKVRFLNSASASNPPPDRNPPPQFPQPLPPNPNQSRKRRQTQPPDLDLEPPEGDSPRPPNAASANSPGRGRRSEQPAQPMSFSFQTPAPQQQQLPSALFQTPPQQQPSQSLFQTPQPQAPMFQTPQAQPFQQSSPFPAFGQPPQFQFQQPQQQQVIQLQQQQQAAAAAAAAATQQQQLLLYTKERAPAGYNTKWEDLHPDSQKLLLQIEERIREYKDESQRLDQCSRLYDSSVQNDSFEFDANRMVQDLGGITNAIEREKISVQGLMNRMNKCMWDTEFAIRSYMMLRPRFLRLNAQNISNAAPGGQSTGSIGASNQLAPSSIPVFDFYSGLPKRPSIFMEHTVARFEGYLTECCQWIEEVEQLVKMDTERTSSSSLEALPKVMSNVHDFFIYVASKVENLHQYVESMKQAYLADQRRRGDGNDPFLEANRREAAKQEAAARRVHPTLHLPAVSPQRQVAGIYSSSAAPVSSIPQLTLGTSLASSSSSGSSLFSTPSSAPAAPSSFLFATPTTSAPSSTLFGTSAFSPQSTPFGTPASSPFGSAQTPTGFGTATPNLGSTSGFGSSSIFSTPLSGAATTSGSSFGAPKSTRPKSRTSRR